MWTEAQFEEMLKNYHSTYLATLNALKELVTKEPTTQPWIACLSDYYTQWPHVIGSLPSQSIAAINALAVGQDRTGGICQAVEEILKILQAKQWPDAQLQPVLTHLNQLAFIAMKLTQVASTMKDQQLSINAN